MVPHFLSSVTLVDMWVYLIKEMRVCNILAKYAECLSQDLPNICHPNVCQTFGKYLAKTLPDSRNPKQFSKCSCPKVQSYVSIWLWQMSPRKCAHHWFWAPKLLTLCFSSPCIVTLVPGDWIGKICNYSTCDFVHKMFILQMYLWYLVLTREYYFCHMLIEHFSTWY